MGIRLARKYGCRGIAEIADLWPESIVAYGIATRDKVVAHLTEKKIPNMIYYPTPQHALPVFVNEPHYEEAFVHADDYCARTLSLPMHPYLSEEEQQIIIDAVLEAL